MPQKPEKAKEYQRYLEFSQSEEYKKLTRGENAVFKDFDPQSAEDLQRLRDYIYNDISPMMRQTKFTNVSSLSISRMQIGMALTARDEYREIRKNEMPKTQRCAPVATTAKNGHVGSIKNFDVSRRVRC